MIQLRAWLSDWYDQAFAAGYIHPPFTLDEVTADRLELPDVDVRSVVTAFRPVRP
ncbi:hypothetical protein [Paraburkholderia youngii]|nr:hypothetical protein [Paraburkholderia youngii]